MLIGLFVEQLFEYGVRLAAFLKVQKIPAVSLSLILILILVALGIRYPLPKLVQNQEEKQWQIFNPQLDSDIRKLVEKTGTNIKILTNYPVDYLPHLQGVGVSYWYDNVSDYQSALKNPEIGYLLIPQNIDPGVETDIQNGLQTGKLKELFSSDGAYAYRMIEVVH
jgi:hypothetical protein